ncbi:hypothetical protein BP6252_03277 [Coleophoma cylindrospora]|uniref:Fungal N-terminal domain-containing protein n=1 Tax=Coleophoma cylindrospora TaxID=1849047 RepID=A0A3D8S784_9HELO|nr:hypothetical protein BP6252_03277 [Coleophoma cylindrospora]
MADSQLPLLTLLLLFTACCVAAFVVGQLISTYARAYLAAPNEVTTFLDAVDFSIQENESYDRDVSKVQKLEDKLRMGKLLREIQKCGDDLREDLNGLMIAEGETRLRSSTRLLWAAQRTRLEERVRRLDMLRMRFLVLYMGLVAANSTRPESMPAKDPEKHHIPKMTLRPSLPVGIAEGIKRKPPMRRLTTQAIGHNTDAGETKHGWASVIDELRMSPLHKRHASFGE